MTVTCCFANLVKMYCILIKEVIWGKVLSAAKPAVYCISCFVVHLKIAPVRMDGGDHGVFWMDHQT